MIDQLIAFYNQNIHRNLPIKKGRSKRMKLRINLFRLYVLVLCIFIGLFATSILEGWYVLLLLLFAFDFIAMRYDKGVLGRLLFKLKADELTLWRELLGKDIPDKKLFRAKRKYKKKRIKKFFRTYGVGSGYGSVVDGLRHRQTIKLTIYTVCVGAIIITTSGFIAAFFDQLFHLDRAMADWDAMDKEALTRFQYGFMTFLVWLVQILKFLVIISPLVLAIVYFRALLIKSDILIALVEDLQLEENP